MKTTTLYYLYSLAILFSIYSCKGPDYSPCKDKINLESLMDEMIDVEAEPCFPAPTFTTLYFRWTSPKGYCTNTNTILLHKEVVSTIPFLMHEAVK